MTLYAPPDPIANEPEKPATQNKKRTVGPPLPEHLLDQGWDTVDYFVRNVELVELER